MSLITDDAPADLCPGYKLALYINGNPFDIANYPQFQFDSDNGVLMSETSLDSDVRDYSMRIGVSFDS